MDLYTRKFCQSCFDINEKIVKSFEALKKDDFNKKTHKFNGRYENLYLDIDKISGLNIIVDKAREQAASILEVNENKLTYGFWLNAMQPGDVTTAHTHDDDDELLSCVYYIKVPKNEKKPGDLIIIKNNEKTVLTPKEGYFVFFSPSTLHEVTKNESEEARLSIAFNFGLVRT